MKVRRLLTLPLCIAFALLPIFSTFCVAEESKLILPLSQSSANDLASRAMLKLDRDGKDFVLDEQHTLVKPYGWVFYYNTREYVEFHNFNAQVPGCCAYLVNRFTGELLPLPSSGSSDAFLKEYEAKLKPADKKSTNPIADIETSKEVR